MSRLVIGCGGGSFISVSFAVSPASTCDGGVVLVIIMWKEILLARCRLWYWGRSRSSPYGWRYSSARSWGSSTAARGSPNCISSFWIFDPDISVQRPVGRVSLGLKIGFVWSGLVLSGTGYVSSRFSGTTSYSKRWILTPTRVGEVSKPCG